MGGGGLQGGCYGTAQPRGLGCVRPLQVQALSPPTSSDLIRTSIHHEYEFAWGIGAIPSEMRRMAPTPWGEIVFMMNIRRD